MEGSCPRGCRGGLPWFLCISGGVELGFGNIFLTFLDIGSKLVGGGEGVCVAMEGYGNWCIWGLYGLLAIWLK